jgi:hypothetical protein
VRFEVADHLHNAVAVAELLVELEQRRQSVRHCVVSHPNLEDYALNKVQNVVFTDRNLSQAEQHGGQLSREEESDAAQGVILRVFCAGEEELGHAVLLELGSGLDEVDQRLGGLLLDGLVCEHEHFEDGVEVPPPALAVLLHDEADLESELGDELLVVGGEQDVEEVLDDGGGVVGGGDDVEQVERHDADEDVVLVEALEDGVAVGLDDAQVVLGHQVEVEQREVLRVGVLHRDELPQHVRHHLAQLRTRLQQHEALEALEQDGVGAVLQVGRHSRAHRVVADHQDLRELLVEAAREPPQRAQELEDGHLQEGVLHAADLVLSVVLLRDQPVGPGDLGDQLDHLRRQRVVEVDGVLQEGHAAQQHAVALLLKARGDLGHELGDVLGHSLGDLNRSQDGLLPDVGRVAADALRGGGLTLRTSWCRSLASSGVQISESTQRVSETILLLLPLRSMRMRLVAIISSSDFSWNSCVSPAFRAAYPGSRCASR